MSTAMHRSAVVLRKVKNEDLAPLFAWMQDKNLLKAINRTSRTTWDTHLVWYKKMVKDESQIVFSIERKETGEFIGQCGLKKIDEKNRKAELWIFIGDKKVRGRGYGSDAVKSLLAYAFQKKRMHRVYLHVIRFNSGAKRFYGRLGFRQEGIFRQDVYDRGNYYDTIHMSMLSEEFEKKYRNEKFIK